MFILKFSFNDLIESSISLFCSEFLDIAWTGSQRQSRSRPECMTMYFLHAVMKVTFDQIYWKVRKAKITIHDIFNEMRENNNIG